MLKEDFERRYILQESWDGLLKKFDELCDQVLRKQEKLNEEFAEWKVQE